MTKATPEQIRVFRHRRLLVILGSIGILLGGFSLMVGLLNFDSIHKDGHVAIVVSLSAVIFTAIVAKVFQVLYFRCPVCSHSIPDVVTDSAVMFGHRCNHCDIDFAA
jgi:hypothetical protein